MVAGAGAITVTAIDISDATGFLEEAGGATGTGMEDGLSAFVEAGGAGKLPGRTALARPAIKQFARIGRGELGNTAVVMIASVRADQCHAWFNIPRPICREIALNQSFY